MHLPDVASELRSQGVRFSFDIVGSGPLEAPLRQKLHQLELADHVRLLEPMDFSTGWIPYLKANTDLFVCCHPQGDPSSTYPEVMSCGAPIAGFANEALAGIVSTSGSGWLAPVGDTRSLARTIASLAQDRESIAMAAQSALTFARQHIVERTFQRRTEHLVRSSRLPDAVRRECSA
jgi:glycosyltransferase involved in cell wall biosynthesis